MCQSLFFNKVALGFQLYLKKYPALVFSCEFYEISENNFFTEHLRTTVSDIWLIVKSKSR